MITYCPMCMEIREGFYCMVHGVRLTDSPKTDKEKVEAVGIVLGTLNRCVGNGSGLETQHPVTLWALAMIEEIIRGRPEKLSKLIATHLRRDSRQMTDEWPKALQEFIGNHGSLSSPECL